MYVCMYICMYVCVMQEETEIEASLMQVCVYLCVCVCVCMFDIYTHVFKSEIWSQWAASSHATAVWSKEVYCVMSHC